MSIEPLAKSLLADAKASRVSRERKAEKRANKNALQNLGVDLLDTVTSGILQSKAQENYVNNFPLQQAMLDQKNLATAKNTYNTHLKAMQSEEGGGNWTTYTSNMLYNQYRKNLVKRSPSYADFAGGEIDHLAQEYADQNTAPIVAAFQNAQKLHRLTKEDPAHIRSLMNSHKLLNPATMGDWVTSKVRRVFDGKTDDEIQTMAVNSIKNDPYLKANKDFLNAVDNISGVRNKAAVASNIAQAAKAVAEKNRFDESNVYETTDFDIKTSDGTITIIPFKNLVSRATDKVVKKIPPNKNDITVIDSESQKDKDALLSTMLTNFNFGSDVQSYVLNKDGVQSYNEAVAQHNEKNKTNIQVYNPRSTADIKVLANILGTISVQPGMLKDGVTDNLVKGLLDSVKPAMIELKMNAINAELRDGKITAQEAADKRKILMEDFKTNFQLMMQAIKGL
tara:strand:+ start:732 stop:2084 length:1353 start_codon:yes stop_codon:yes gene_type:complete